MNYTIPLLSFCCFLSFICVSQTSFEAGIFGGGTMYYGELSNQHGTFEELGYAVGVSSRYMLNRNFGVKASIGLMQLTGSDETATHTSRNWRMKNDIIELAATFEYHPIGQGRRNLVGRFNRNQFSPYVLFGAGVSLGEAVVTTPLKDAALFPESGSTNNFVILPIGLGIRLDLSKYALLSFEFGKRAVFSDYIDGVSTNGNKSTNDWYAFGGIHIGILIDAEIDRRF